MFCLALLPWMFYIVLYSFEYFRIYWLVGMTALQVCLIVLVAAADEKQVSTYTECLRKTDALMRRQTTPVR